MRIFAICFLSIYHSCVSLIQHNLSLVKESILFSTQRANRDPKTIKLIAVSKTKSVEEIRQAIDCGQHDFGESYVQEFIKKMAGLKHESIQWHFVGHLQRNKAKDIVGNVTLIHTLDRENLARTVNDLAQKKGIIQDCLIQAKLAAEETKTGCEPKDLRRLLGLLNDLNSIRVLGLMTLGTLTDNLQIIRNEYRLLRQLRDDLNEHKMYKLPLTELSMGMSDDFKIAIEEGATIIRVGTGIFGER